MTNPWRHTPLHISAGTASELVTKPHTDPQPGPFLPHLVPLQHAPHRIRPPFDIAGHDSASDPRLGETTDQWRTRIHTDRVTAPREPLDGIALGQYDRRIIDWHAGWDIPIIGTIASLLYRAHAIDPTHGAS